jgi:hypothetical protein
VVSSAITITGQVGKMLFVLGAGWWARVQGGWFDGALVLTAALLALEWFAMRERQSMRRQSQAMQERIQRLAEQASLVSCDSVAGSHPPLQEQLRKLQRVVVTILEGVNRHLVSERALNELEQLLSKIVPSTLSTLHEGESADSVRQVCDEVRVLRAQMVAGYLRPDQPAQLDSRFAAQFGLRPAAGLRRAHTLMGWRLS